MRICNEIIPNKINRNFWRTSFKNPQEENDLKDETRTKTFIIQRIWQKREKKHDYVKEIKKNLKLVFSSIKFLLYIKG